MSLHVYRIHIYRPVKHIANYQFGGKFKNRFVFFVIFIAKMCLLLVVGCLYNLITTNIKNKKDLGLPIIYIYIYVCMYIEMMIRLSLIFLFKMCIYQKLV